MYITTESVIQMKTEINQKSTASSGDAENAGPLKMQGWKKRDWKTQDLICRGGKRRTTV